MRALAIGIFLIVLLATAVLFAPLRVGLDLAGASRIGLGAASVDGTIWSGTLRSARWGGLGLGDVAVRLDPWALLKGDLRVAAEARDGAFVGRAVLVRSSAGTGLTDINGAIPLGVVRTALPLQGMVALDKASAIFAEGRCAAADGAASTDALKDAGGPLLKGGLSCSEGRLVVPLTGRGPQGETAVILRIDGAGAYQAESRITSSDPQVNAGLRLAGFTPAGAGQVRTTQGRLWP